MLLRGEGCTMNLTQVCALEVYVDGADRNGSDPEKSKMMDEDA